MKQFCLSFLIVVMLGLSSMSMIGISEESDPLEPLHRQLDFDEDTQDWVYEEPDTSTGTMYRLWEHHGGFWADAEKSPSNTEDDLLCWAATCSNMLEWTGWGFVGGMNNGNTDDFLTYYIDHTTDLGSLNEYGLEWWFNGNLPCPDPTVWSSEDVPGADFWSGSYTWSNYVHISWSNTNIMTNINSWLHAGYPVGLSIYPISPPGGHAITCWGYNYNPSATSPNDYYLGVWVTDSDSHKHLADPDDVLRYFEVEYEDHGTSDTSDDYWYMPNYGSGWKIDGVCALEPFPGETRPVADAGGPYSADEASTVWFDGSGSTDDDGLTYRWDFDDDGTWDTGWLTSTMATHTWDDDYSGTVRLEVFDGRLRDVDTTTVTINNVAPSISPVVLDVDEHDLTTLSTTLYDPSPLDAFQATFDWGDGTIEGPISYPSGTSMITRTHQYLDDDPSGTPFDDYTVTLTVQDDDGGTTVDNDVLTVFNVNPVVSVISPNGGEMWGGTHDILWDISDQGTLDTFTSDIYYSSDLGGHWTLVTSGIGGGHGTDSFSWDTTSFQESADGLIKVEVIDDDTGTHEDTSDAPFIVDNTPPVTNKTFTGETFGPNDYYVSIPNMVDLDAYDALSGVAATYYRISFDGTWTPTPGTGIGINNDYQLYTSSFSLDQEGIYFIEFYSVDQADNIEALTNQTHVVYDWWPMYQHDAENTGRSHSTIPDDSTVLWRTQLGAPVKSSPAVAYEDLLYIGCHDGNVYCLNATTGALIWSFDTGYWVESSPLVMDDRVYVGSHDGTVYCLDYQTGMKQWSVKTKASVMASPVGEDSLVIVGSDSLYAFNATDGSVIWNVNLGANMRSSPAVGDGLVFAAGLNGHIVCVSQMDGSLVWSTSLYAPIQSSPTIIDDDVVIGCDNGDLFCYHASTGLYRWTASTYGAILASPVGFDDSVVVASGDGRLYRFDMCDGSKIWSKFIAPFTMSSPAIVGDRLVLGSFIAKLYCVNLTSGTVDWSYQTRGGIYSSPAVFRDRVYVGSNDGNVFCFGSDPSNPHPMLNPTAIIGGPYGESPNIPLMFDASASKDEDDKGDGIVQYDWKFSKEDNWHDNLGPQPSFTYPLTGQYVVSVRVMDDEGIIDVDSTVVDISDGSVQGDMNGDGRLNAGDIRYIAMFLAGDPLFQPLFADGDANGDGRLNAGDVRYLAMYLAGDPRFQPLYP